MMNYKEIIAFEKAFESFLRKLIKNRDIKIRYQHRLGGERGYDCAFIGYETNNDGFHGIHYNKQLQRFSFGTRNKKLGKNPGSLNESQKRLIPDIIKMAMIEVAGSTRVRIIEKTGVGWTSPK